MAYTSNNCRWYFFPSSTDITTLLKVSFYLNFPVRDVIFAEEGICFYETTPELFNNKNNYENDIDKIADIMNNIAVFAINSSLNQTKRVSTYMHDLDKSNIDFIKVTFWINSLKI